MPKWYQVDYSVKDYQTDHLPTAPVSYSEETLHYLKTGLVPEGTTVDYLKGLADTVEKPEIVERQAPTLEDIRSYINGGKKEAAPVAPQQPAYHAPVYSQPAAYGGYSHQPYAAPAYGYGAPAYGAPAYGGYGYGAPAYGAPAYGGYGHGGYGGYGGHFVDNGYGLQFGAPAYGAYTPAYGYGGMW